MHSLSTYQREQRSLNLAHFCLKFGLLSDKKEVHLCPFLCTVMPDEWCCGKCLEEEVHMLMLQHNVS